MAIKVTVELNRLPDTVEEEEIKREILRHVSEILQRCWGGDMPDTEAEGPGLDYNVSAHCIGSPDGIESLDITITETGSGACTYYSLGPDGNLVETSPPPTLQQ